MQSFAPTVIRRSDPTRLEIDWSDGHTSKFTPAGLRALCPCAQCVNELTGVRTLDINRIPPDLQQSGVAMVGNYGISLQFSDGHHTGIYTFKYLREHDPDGK